MEAKHRIEELRKTITEHNRRYYVENAPSISDYEFDQLLKELEKLESEHPEYASADSPTQRVGSDLAKPSQEKTGGFVQKTHRYPMLSLSNTYSIAEIEEFVQRADKALGGEKFSYSCELKFDGTAICLRYKDGRLSEAITRGDGTKGDDITRNALQISNIPHKLHGDFPSEFEIRGEVMMPYDSFERLNAQRLEKGEAPFANPRNAASGSIKLLTAEEVKERGLFCTLYHIPAESIAFASHEEALDKAASWGLPISDSRKICNGIEGIKQYIDYWDIHRSELPYATDGVVIKINELSSQRSLGYTAKSPRWAVAYKFKAEQASTKLLSIDYQVGRTGAVTPVANLESVLLSGTIVKRATLNNAELMAEMDIRVGDYVFVEKGGEIIPKITGVDFDQRAPGLEKPAFPANCPDCGTALVKAEGEAKWFCPNDSGCPMQIKGRILHFVGRKAMDILCGEAGIDQFYSAGLASSPADLYSISKLQLVALEGWKEKSAQNFLDSLEKSKSVPFERVLFALGIRYVGETTAKSIAKHFGDIEHIAAASVEELTQIGDVGAVIAESVYAYMHSPVGLEQIERLKAAGLQFAAEADQGPKSDSLSGLSIVVSGNFSIPRDKIKEMIAAHGGKVSSSISSKTSFLLAGEKSGPEKLKKCEQLGIRLVSEAEFMQMIPGEKAVRKEEIIEELTLF